MRYLKYYGQQLLPSFEIITNTNEIKQYVTTIDDVEYRVEFTLFNHNIWNREYDIEDKYTSYDQVNKNPYNIINSDSFKRHASSVSNSSKISTL